MVIVRRESVTETAARDMRYRRERNRVGSGDVYADLDETNIDSAFLGRPDHFAGLRVVFHAALRANIEGPAPEMLARLALDSAAAPSGAVARDGISYLMAAKQSGIVTPLIAGYEREILRQTGGRSLKEALAIARGESCYRPGAASPGVPNYPARQLFAWLGRHVLRPLAIGFQIAFDRHPPHTCGRILKPLTASISLPTG